ncbi:MAG: hypothetical protein AAFV29_26120, partial [Myxococcota bacterium]
SDPAGATWRALSSVPETLAQLTVDAPLCPTFQAPRRESVESVEALTDVILTPLSADRALLITRAERSLESLRVVVGPEGLDVRAREERINALQRVGAELWLADLDGQFFSATPDLFEGWIDVTSLPVEGLERRIDAFVTSGTTDDIFAVTDGAQLRHYDGDQWREVGAIALRNRQIVSDGFAKALAIGTDGRLLAATASALSLVEVEGAASLTTVQNVPPFGVVVGDAEGQLFRRNGDAWTLLTLEPFGFDVFPIEPFDDGFVYLTSVGASGFYSEATGACTGILATGAVDDARILNLDGNILAATQRFNQDIIDVWWVPKASN